MKKEKEDSIVQRMLAIRKDIDSMPEKMVEQAGKKALDIITDYPLYAASSNITYTDAILVALALNETV